MYGYCFNDVIMAESAFELLGEKLVFFSHGSITPNHVRVDLDGNDENSIVHDDAMAMNFFVNILKIDS